VYIYHIFNAFTHNDRRLCNVGIRSDTFFLTRTYGQVRACQTELQVAARSRESGARLRFLAK
jgi:hypothetical protein